MAYTSAILLGYLLLGVALVLLLFVLVTAVGNFVVRVPFVPVSQQVAEEMVRFAGLKGNETVCDPGAGDGRILMAAKRLHPQIKAIGWEYAPTVWLLGKLRIWWSGLDITLRLGNSMRQDMRGADCMLLYLFATVMPALEEKFDRELRAGTKVVSYVFPFPHRRPVAQTRVSCLGRTQRLWLYQW